MCPNPHHQIRSDSGSLSMQEGQAVLEIGEPPFEGQTDRDGQKDTLRVAATFDGLIDLLDFSGLIKTFSITLQRIEPGHHKKWGADSKKKWSSIS